MAQKIRVIYAIGIREACPERSRMDPWLNIIEFTLRSLCLKIRLIRVNSWLIKKSCFWPFFC